MWHVLLVLCEIGELDLCTLWRVDLFYSYHEMSPYGADGWLFYLLIFVIHQLSLLTQLKDHDCCYSCCAWPPTPLHTQEGILRQHTEYRAPL